MSEMGDGESDEEFFKASTNKMLPVQPVNNVFTREKIKYDYKFDPSSDEEEEVEPKTASAKPVENKVSPPPFIASLWSSNSYGNSTSKDPSQQTNSFYQASSGVFPIVNQPSFSMGPQPIVIPNMMHGDPMCIPNASIMMPVLPPGLPIIPGGAVSNMPSNCMAYSTNVPMAGTWLSQHPGLPLPVPHLAAQQSNPGVQSTNFYSGSFPSAPQSAIQESNHRPESTSSIVPQTSDPRLPTLPFSKPNSESEHSKTAQSREIRRNAVIYKPPAIKPSTSKKIPERTPSPNVSLNSAKTPKPHFSPPSKFSRTGRPPVKDIRRKPMPVAQEAAGFKNDGSFLEVFKQKMKEGTSTTDEATGAMSVAVMAAKTNPRDVELTTAPFDPRFPNTNQTKYCYTSFLDYHRCQKARGTDYEPCNYFKKVFTSVCPNAWVEKWNDQLSEGTFPGRI